MLEQPDSPTASQTKRQVFDHYLLRLQGEIHTIIASETDYEERLKSQQNELGAFRRAHRKLEHEKVDLIDEVARLRARLDEVTVKKRIVCILDGNDLVFNNNLLAQGRAGGQAAAKQLNDVVHYHLSSVPYPLSLWTYVFYNRCRILDALAGLNYKAACDEVNNFVGGFNEVCDRFLMVDVGSCRAEAKVKAHLEENAHSLETHKVLIGASHYNDYISSLQSLILAGCHDRLILLHGDGELDPEVEQLRIPSLVVPNLFLSVDMMKSKLSSSHDDPTPCSNINHSCNSPRNLSHHLKADLTESSASDEESVSSLTLTEDDGAPPSPKLPAHVEGSSINCSRNYLAALQADPVRQMTLSKFNGGVRHKAKWMQVRLQPRHINHSIPISQHDPPPCTLYYLAAGGCKHGADCRFGHDYELEEDDYDVLRANARKVPCPALNKGEACIFGETCCYGHVCPFGTKCFYYKQGNCKFVKPSMHRDSWHK